MSKFIGWSFENNSRWNRAASVPTSSISSSSDTKVPARLLIFTGTQPRDRGVDLALLRQRGHGEIGIEADAEPREARTDLLHRALRAFGAERIAAPPGGERCDPAPLRIQDRSRGVAHVGAVVPIL